MGHGNRRLAICTPAVILVRLIVTTTAEAPFTPLHWSSGGSLTSRHGSDTASKLVLPRHVSLHTSTTRMLSEPEDEKVDVRVQGEEGGVGTINGSAST